MSSREGETIYRKDEKKPKSKPKPKPKPLPSPSRNTDDEEMGEDVMQGMSPQTARYFDKLKVRVGAVCKEKGIPAEKESAFMNIAHDNIIHSDRPTVAVKQMLTNIKENKATAKSLDELVFAIRGQLPQGSDITMSEASTVGKDTLDIIGEDPTQLVKPHAPVKKPASVRSAMVEEKEFMSEDNYDPYKNVNQSLTSSQIKHIEEVVKILEKEPKLKSDIKRTITEELTKGYIKPDQYKKYNQEIERVQIEKEAPIAVRGTRKPRAKKSAQADTPLVPMDIETIENKVPKGKPMKDGQKKKPKVVTL